MKKLLSFLLVIVITFSLFNGVIITGNAITDYTTGETADGITYSIDNETDELTVTWAEFSTKDLVIPSYIEGHPVTAIGANFLNDTPNPNLQSVVIPNTVKKIGFGAFGNCINLTSVVMSDNIERVEDYAFLNTALSNNEDDWENGALYLGKFLYGVSTDYSGEFEIKDGTRVVGSQCFHSRYNWNGCEKITKIVIPDSVVSIELMAFHNCKGITSIDIPESVKYIGNVAFSGCTNLLKINCNTSKLEYVGQNIASQTAFYNDESNWQDDVLYLGTAALCGNNTITNLKVKEGTEIIADYAFACNDNLVSVSLPGTLKTICDLAFDDLHSLSSIELPDGLEYIAANAFDGCDMLTELDIPQSVNYIGLFAFNRTDKLEKLIIRNPECRIVDNHDLYAGGAYSVNPNTTVYGDAGSTAKTFANNNGVKFETLLSETGECDGYVWTFDNVSGVLSISSIRNYSIQIYKNAPWVSFRESIKSVIVDSKIYSVGANVFEGFEALESVYMPGVYNVGDSAFEGCTSLKNVELSSNYSSSSTIGKNAFAYCSTLTKILIPFQYVTIGEKSFYNCENLKTLGIYRSANIGDNAFLYCSHLSSVYMLNNGTPFSGTVSNNAFSGVNADVYYYYRYSPSNQNSRFGGQFNYIKMTSGFVGYNAYWNYDQTDESLTITGKGELFKYSSGNDLPWMDFLSGITCTIETIVIEDGITEIPSYAFEYMENVKSVSLPNTLLKLYPNAFNNCKLLTEIVIPASVEYVDGKSYWNRCPNLTDAYYIGTEQEWNEVYQWAGGSYGAECITPHFLVYHPATQTCTKAGYPAHYEFDGTANTTFYDTNKVAISAPEVKPALGHTWNKGEVIKEATTTEEGQKLYTCTVCGEIKKERIPNLVDEAQNTYHTADGKGIKLNGIFTPNDDDPVKHNISLSEFKNLEILGVQKKKTGEKSIRYVVAAKDDILQDADEYGFILAGASTIDEARNKVEGLDYNNAGGLKFECTGTNNNISGDYGKFDAQKDYKYITFGVNRIRDNAVAAKFYVKKGDNIFYATYTNNQLAVFNSFSVNWEKINR